MSHLRTAQATAPPRALQIKVSWPVQLTAIACLAVYGHCLMWRTEPRDMSLWLGPWFQHLVRYGPVSAFAQPFSNYTPAYLYLLAVASLFHGILPAMYLIKLLSIAGTAFAAFALADLITTCGGKPRFALLIFALPSTTINSALLAQCDALWAGCCLLAVSAMIGGRTVRSLVWCGVAIAFKAQAIFIAPFIVGVLIGRREPLWQWAVPGLVFAVWMLPAWLAGWPALDLALIYPRQPGFIDSPGRLANPWMFGTAFAPETAAELYWLGFAAAAAASAALIALTSNCARNPRTMLLLALLSSLVLPFFLPKMLERYYFLADLLSVALAVSYASRITIFIAAAVQLSSLLSLISYMYFYATPFPTLVGVFFAAAALATSFILARESGAEWPKLLSRTSSSEAQPAWGRGITYSAFSGSWPQFIKLYRQRDV